MAELLDHHLSQMALVEDDEVIETLFYPSGFLSLH